MGKSMAEVLREEGEVRKSRQTLLRQLRLRFGDLPQAVIDAVEGCSDIAQLDAWLERFATARRLADVGIVPRR